MGVVEEYTIALLIVLVFGVNEKINKKSLEKIILIVLLSYYPIALSPYYLILYLPLFII